MNLHGRSKPVGATCISHTNKNDKRKW